MIVAEANPQTPILNTKRLQDFRLESHEGSNHSIDFESQSVSELPLQRININQYANVYNSDIELKCDGTAAVSCSQHSLKSSLDIILE